MGDDDFTLLNKFLDNYQKKKDSGDSFSPHVQIGRIIAKKWTILRFINNGGCGEVYEVEDKKKNKYAMKITSDSFSFTISHEYKIYKTLGQCEYIPKLPTGAFGYDNGYTYLIMSLLNKNLRQYRRNFCDRKVPFNIIHKFGHYLIDFLQYIHSKKYIYVDVKPENFMIEYITPNLEQIKLYAIDFGLVQQYIRNGKHRPFKYVKSRVGTINFMSIHMENRMLPSRRDDLESLAYVLIFLSNGYLPWEYAGNDTQGLELKIYIKESLPDINPVLYEFLENTKKLKYDENPNYNQLKIILDKLIINNTSITSNIRDISGGINLVLSSL